MQPLLIRIVTSHSYTEQSGRQTINTKYRHTDSLSHTTEYSSYKGNGVSFYF